MRPWLLAIVRNACFSWLRANRPREIALTLDETGEPPDDARGADEELVRRAEGDRVRRALEELPVEFREVIILREMEELSYREIAGVAGIPVGTVMSRIARARRRLQVSLGRDVSKETLP